MNEAIETLQYLSNIQDLVDLADFVDDDRLRNAMDKMVKIMYKPEIPHAKIGAMITEFTVWGNIFAAEAATYMTIKKAKAGTENNYKKNIYFTMSEECHKLAAALKYQARTYE